MRVKTFFKRFAIVRRARAHALRAQGRFRDEWIMATANLARISKAEPSFDPSDILLFCVIRNEGWRLPGFFAYYRKLGVNQFVLIDNGSSDGGADYALKQPDCVTYWTRDSYGSAMHGTLWIKKLQRRFAKNLWCVHVDADEYLVYPGSETITLQVLRKKCEASGANALRAMLLDMYAPGDLRNPPPCAPEQDPWFVYRYFDRDTHFTDNEPERSSRFMQPSPRVFGGMRTRIFGSRPSLDKLPFYQFDGELDVGPGTHACQNARFARIQGAVLHFKYTHNFAQKVGEEVRRKEHWMLAREYVSYEGRLKQSQPVSPLFEGSVEYQGTHTLVELGIMREDPET